MARGYRFGVVGNLSTVPDGRNVLPVNDVSLLLQCAGIKGSTITTLAELFADTTTLATVISNNNAIDYLVRSTTFAKQEALVPTMTSDTTPSGTAFMEDEHSTAKAYKAFDKDNTTTAQTASSSSIKKIGYQFPTPVKIYRADYYVSYGSAPSSIQIKVCHSNDGTNYTDDTSLLSVTNGVNKVVPIQPSDAYKYWRIDVTISDNKSIAANEIQFYSEQGFTDNATAMTYIGANNYASNTLLGNSTWLNAICNSTYFESVLNFKNPVMTSNNTPSGECFGSTASDSGYTFYRAFDNNSSTSYRSNATTSGTYVGYTFTSAKKIVFAKLSCTNLGSSSAQRTLSIDGSNDSANWNSLGSVELTIPATTTTDSNVVLNNNTNYVSYRLYATSSTGRLVIPELNFYGRVDV